MGPALLLPEVSGAIARQTGRPELALRAVSLIQSLSNMRLVVIDAELSGLAARLAANLRLRGADAVYISLARRMGIPLVAWVTNSCNEAEGWLRSPARRSYCQRRLRAPVRLAFLGVPASLQPPGRGQPTWISMPKRRAVCARTAAASGVGGPPGGGSSGSGAGRAMARTNSSKSRPVVTVSQRAAAEATL